MAYIIGISAIIFTVDVLSLVLLVYRRKKSQSKASEELDNNKNLN